MRFSVVIPTYNRPELVVRAIGSVLTHLPQAEVLVVDDASDDSTRRAVAQFPTVRYLRQPENRGPGAARNLGIEKATGDWVILLDDDDMLREDAGEILSCAILTTPQVDRYPVLQFRTQGAVRMEPYRLSTIADYLAGSVAGDFTAVLQMRAFRTAGLQDPDNRIGAEHELWYRVAQGWGIPTWAEEVVDVHRENGVHLCSVESQILQARQHAISQEHTLQFFGHLMEGRFRRSRLRHLLGASAYWLIAGDRSRSRGWSRAAARQYASFRAAGLFGLSYLPAACARTLLRGYRRLQRV